MNQEYEDLIVEKNHLNQNYLNFPTYDRVNFLLFRFWVELIRD